MKQPLSPEEKPKTDDLADLLDLPDPFDLPDLPEDGEDMSQGTHDNAEEAPEDAFAAMEAALRGAQEKLKQFEKQRASAPGEEAPARETAAEAEEKRQSFAQFCKTQPKDCFPLGCAREDGRPLGLNMGAWHKLGVYLGHPETEEAVLANLLTSAAHAGMQVMVLRRKLFTHFEDGHLFQHAGLTPDDAAYWNGDASGLQILNQVLHRELSNQNQVRDEYCARQGIAADDRQRTHKASAYIRQNTRPLMIVFERVADLIRCGAPEPALECLALYLTGSVDYNIMFVGLFYGDDPGEIWQHPVAQAFAGAPHALLVGGRHPDQQLMQVPQALYLREAEQNAERFLLRQSGAVVEGCMPPAGLRTDLDEFQAALQALMRETAAYDEAADPPGTDPTL